MIVKIILKTSEYCEMTHLFECKELAWNYVPNDDIELVKSLTGMKEGNKVLMQNLGDSAMILINCFGETTTEIFTNGIVFIMNHSGKTIERIG
jgi:hypothetical protein